MSVTVVFWDFDGTLAYRKGGMWSAALADALREVCPESRLRREDLSPLLRTGFPWHEPDTPHLDLCEPDAWWRRVSGLLSGVLIEAGIRDADAAACAKIVRWTYTSPSAWALFDDSAPALEAVRESGARNIVLSNHVPELESLADALGVSPLLDGVLTSALTGYEKPHRRAFEIALEFAGRPARAYMVGDNPRADVAGAESVGITGLLIDRSGQNDGCAKTLSSLRDVIGCLGVRSFE